VKIFRRALPSASENFFLGKSLGFPPTQPRDYTGKGTLNNLFSV
jgi:hypothetical protein